MIIRYLDPQGERRVPVGFTLRVEVCRWLQWVSAVQSSDQAPPSRLEHTTTKQFVDMKNVSCAQTLNLNPKP